MLDPLSGQFEFAASGPAAGLVVRAAGHATLHGDLQFLGENPDAAFHVSRAQLAPGDALLLFHPVPGAYAARETAARDALPLEPALLAALLERPWASELAARVRGLRDVAGQQLSTRLEATWRDLVGDDAAEPTLVIVRRDRATP
jgi:hypothetical protein